MPVSDDDSDFDCEEFMQYCEKISSSSSSSAAAASSSSAPPPPPPRTPAKRPSAASSAASSSTSPLPPPPPPRKKPKSDEDDVSKRVVRDERDVQSLMKRLQESMRVLFHDVDPLQPVLQKDEASYEHSDIGRRLSNSPNDRKYSIRSIQKSMINSQRQQTAPCSVLTCHSNYEGATLKYAIQNMQSLIDSVIRDFGSFTLTPAQRLAAAMLLRPIDVATTTRIMGPTEYKDFSALYKVDTPYRILRLSRDDQVEREHRFPVMFKTLTNVSTPAGGLSSYRFLDFLTGCGKTAVTIAATLASVCDDDTFESLKAMHHLKNDIAMTHPYTGLHHYEHGLTPVNVPIARLVVFLVPEGVIEQWEEHLNSVKYEAFKKYGKEIVVWAETKRRGKGYDRSIAAAHALDRPVFWVMSEQKRCRDLLKNPHIAHAVTVMDEQTHRSGTRNNPFKEMSRPCVSVVVNATLSHLETITDRASHHPLSYVFEGTWTGSTRCDYHNARHTARCCAVTKQSSLPHWLADMVHYECRSLMPVNVHMHDLSLRAPFKLQTKILKFDLIEMSVHRIFRDQVTGGLSRGYSPSMTTVFDELMSGSAAVLKDDCAVKKEFIQYLDGWLKSKDADWQTNVFLPSIERREWMNDERYEHAKKEAYDWFLRLHARVSSFRDTANSCVEEDDEVECPITMEVVPVAERVIINCCYKVLPRKVIQEIDERSGGNGKCPFCRTPFANLKIATSNAAASTDDKAPEPDSVYDALFTDISVEAMQRKFKDLPINEKLGGSIQWFRETVKKQPGTMEGIAALLRVLANVKRDVRTLVVVRDPNVGNVEGATQRKKMLDKLRSGLPPDFTVELIDGTMASVKNARSYKDARACPSPHVLCLLLRDGQTSTVAGLDLWMTDVTIFETSMGSSSTLVQALGRCMRMSESNKNTDKHLIVLK